MSNALGYNFDEVQLKRDCYRPAAHGNLEEDQYLLRKGLLELLAGTKPLSIKDFVESEKNNQKNS